MIYKYQTSVHKRMNFNGNMFISSFNTPYSACVNLVYQSLLISTYTINTCLFNCIWWGFCSGNKRNRGKTASYNPQFPKISWWFLTRVLKKGNIWKWEVEGNLRKFTEIPCYYLLFPFPVFPDVKGCMQPSSAGEHFYGWLNCLDECSWMTWCVLCPLDTPPNPNPFVYLQVLLNSAVVVEFHCKIVNVRRSQSDTMWWQLYCLATC